MKNSFRLFSFFLTLIIYSCSNDNNVNENPTITNLTTEANCESTFTSLKISGQINTNDAEAISSRGVCWNTSLNPTIENNLVNTSNENINVTIPNLYQNTTYYFRLFVIINDIIFYGENQVFDTLSLENTTWKFSTIYPENGFVIESTVDFFEDGTTKFDEIGAGQGFFITYGTWSVSGNTLTYIWEGNDAENSTYVYSGRLSGLTMNGTYTHTSIEGNKIWNAFQLN